MGGVSPTAMPSEWKQASLDELRRAWADVGARQRAFLADLGEAALDRTVPYANIAGEPLASSISEMLRHVVNHSTYHRGQIVTMLRQLGKRPPSTDMILYFRTASR